MTYTLGIDLGTQGIKALLLDVETGCVVARSSVDYGLLQGLPAGAAEQHPALWRSALAELLYKLNQEEDVSLERVLAIGVSAQQHGAVLLDAADKPVRAAKLWCDTTTAAEAKELAAAFRQPLATGFTASKLLWTARHEAEQWARTRRVLLPHDYLNLLLTGEAAMEAGDASGTGFFDVRARRFDSERLAAFDGLTKEGAGALAARLPRLMDPAQPALPLGRVQRSAAEEFGLPEGALVSAGGGDNMMSAIGSGATRPGVVTMSLGTSGTIFAHADEPILDPDGLIAGFCGATGGWLPLLCVMNVTGVTEEVSQAFGRSHGELTRAAGKVPAGCDGLSWLPFLNGERVPDLPLASGSLLGMRPGHLRAGILYRAALEGTSLNLAWGLSRLRALGIVAAELRLVGGAARNPLWSEILAACCQVPVRPLAEPESAALGACLQALWCWRSEGGERISIDELANPCLRWERDAQAPDARLSAYYQEALSDFSLRVGELY